MFSIIMGWQGFCSMTLKVTCQREWELVGLALTIKCPGLEVAYIISIYNSLARTRLMASPPTSKGPESIILPCPWNTDSWKKNCTECYMATTMPLKSVSLPCLRMLFPSSHFHSCRHACMQPSTYQSTYPMFSEHLSGMALDAKHMRQKRSLEKSIILLELFKIYATSLGCS